MEFHWSAWTQQVLGYQEFQGEEQTTLCPAIMEGTMCGLQRKHEFALFTFLPLSKHRTALPILPKTKNQLNQPLRWSLHVGLYGCAVFLENYAPTSPARY